MKSIKTGVLLLGLAVGGNGKFYAQSFTQLTAPNSNLPGWGTMLPHTGITQNAKRVADFNGDNLDDIFWAFMGNVGSTSTSNARIINSNGAGSFATYYDNGGQTYINTTTSDQIDMVNYNGYVAGNFYANPGGFAGAEMINYRTDLAVNANCYYMLAWPGTTPTKITFQNTGSIGSAPIKTQYGSTINYTRFYSGNFTGSALDELLSIEKNAQTGMVTVRIQSYQTFSQDFVQSWTANYNFNIWTIDFANDEFHICDVNPWNNTSGNIKDELVCINRLSGRIMIFDFNEQTMVWDIDYDNGGNFNVYANPSGNNSYVFNTSTTFLVGNFDISDFHAEFMVFPANQPSQACTMQWDYATATMENKMVPAINTTGIAGNSTGTSVYVSPIELWGSSFATQRQFYVKTFEDGNLEYVLGNFYTASPSNPTNENLEVMIFYNSKVYTPSGFTNSGYFTTSCGTYMMTSPNCPATMNCYNMASQLINVYDRINDRFTGNVVAQNTKYALYSSNNGQNLKEMTGLTEKTGDGETVISAGVYPNPLVGNGAMIKINAPDSRLEGYSISIFDTRGAIVKRMPEINGPMVTLEPDGLSDGIYLVMVYDGTGLAVASTRFSFINR